MTVCKMNVGELIDELLDFELSDEVSYANIFIKVNGEEWNLSKTSFSAFQKWTLDQRQIAINSKATQGSINSRSIKA